MKKKLLFATIILVLLAGVLYYISLPDYLVFNSMSFSNGANRDTELQVIVYQYWNIDEVVAEIKAEHNQINGTPTTLTINLHRSKWSFHNGYEPFIPLLSIMIEEEKQTVLSKNCLLQAESCHSGNSISLFIFINPYFSYNGRPISVASNEIEKMPLLLLSLISISNVL